MDPITLLAAASAVWSGIKKASEFAQEAEGVWCCTYNADLAQWIADNCEFRQLILKFYTVGVPDSGWVHVSFNLVDNKKQVLTATKKDGKTVYLQGLVA
jgi:hypothetical protein